MTSPTPRRVLLPASVLLAVLISGCSSAAESNVPAPEELAPTTAQAAELPPGAEDVWGMNLSGNLIEDMSDYMDVDRLTGEDGVFTATQFTANQVSDVCMADTDRIAAGLESDLERNVRLTMDSSQIDDGDEFVRLLASYGCPEDMSQVDAAIEKAS